METHSIIERRPLDYLKIIFRRKWLLVIPVILGIIGGIIYGNVLPKIYRASTLILVEEGRTINPLIHGLAVSTSTAQRLAVLRQKILSWEKISQLIKKLNLAKNVRSQAEFENLVNHLRKKIRVGLSEHNVVSISYEDENNVQAMNVVKTITDIFIAENLRQQQRETEVAISFINDQLALYQKKLKQSEIAAMEDELNKLLVDSTEKHPMVIELRKNITAAKKELEKGDYAIHSPSTTESDPDLKILKEELSQMRQELATSSLDAQDEGVSRAKLSSATNEKLYKLLLLDKIDKVEARDAGVNQKLYNELLERLETAKITQSLEASKEGTRYTVLDPARLPLKPVKPNKLFVLLMGAFLGSCVGTCLVFSVEMFDHSFLGVDEAKEYLNLPIFGAIPKIITQDDIKAQRMRWIKIASLSIISGVVLIAIIIINVVLG
jgi:uncharacterized protein involved in exopolysaccharide biosynthesis